MKLVDSKMMRSLDSLAIKKGTSGIRLMENAGEGVAEIAAEMLEAEGGKKVGVLTGKGNNGGDGFVVARVLALKGYDVRVFSTSTISKLTGDAKVNGEAWKRMDGETLLIGSRGGLEKHSDELKDLDLIVDALFGTGLSSEVKSPYAAIIDLINSLGCRVLSVDVPSGIDATTGAVLGTAIKADVTACFALAKLGLFLNPGSAFAGRVEVVDIGITEEIVKSANIRWELTGEEEVQGLLRPREADAHKGSQGHLAVIAGSTGKTGAAYMAAMAAMRSGTGLVTIGLPVSLNAVMEAKTTEVMTCPLEEAECGLDVTLSEASLEGAASLIKGKAAIVVGPGLGDSVDVARFVKGLLSLDDLPPIVIDADALNALDGKPSQLKKIASPMVLTPHPGEMARLMNSTVAEVQADRVGFAEKLSKRTGAVVVLKGAPTVIAEPNGRVAINSTGGPALATAGTRDQLTGMIGAFLARGLAPFESARCAVYLHGLAGDSFAEEAGGSDGMLATDLLGLLPSLVNAFTSVGADRE